MHITEGDARSVLRAVMKSLIADIVIMKLRYIFQSVWCVLNMPSLAMQVSLKKTVYGVRH